MKRFLLVGCSNIARQRILPALAGLGAAVEVASESGIGAALPRRVEKTWDDYGRALRQTTASFVYVSTANHRHAEVVQMALEYGRHTIVDKPAFLDLTDARRLAALAESRGVLLAEANVYGSHPQIAAIREIFSNAGIEPSRIAALFSFPPLPQDNFRYDPARGGGALLDLGPYAVTPGRLLFGAEPEHVSCRILSRSGVVETAYSVQMVYSKGRSMIGHYGFDTGYVNRLDVLGEHTTVSLDRAFTTPPDKVPNLRATQHNQVLEIDVPAADTFAVFLVDAIRAASAGELRGHRKTLLADAELLERLRASSAS